MKTEKIIFRNALKIYLGIVVYFFLMLFLNAAHISELRILNFVFVFWGINSAVKTNIFKNQKNTYLANLFIGFATSFAAVIMIGASLMVYLFYINPFFIEVIKESFFWGNDLTPPIVAFAIIVEGFASSIVCSFIVIQYWKRYKIEKEGV
jgi:hypothetical protein